MRHSAKRNPSHLFSFDVVESANVSGRLKVPVKRRRRWKSFQASQKPLGRRTKVDAKSAMYANCMGVDMYTMPGASREREGRNRLKDVALAAGLITADNCLRQGMQSLIPCSLRLSISSSRPCCSEGCSVLILTFDVWFRHLCSCSFPQDLSESSE